MRNDADKWDSVTDQIRVLETDDISISPVLPKRQTLISGVSALQQTEHTLVDWPGKVANDQYALVLRRDRILEINGPERVTGWDDSTECAVSDMSDGYSVLRINGRSALALLSRGGFVNPQQPSQSVARILFGLPVLLYQHQEPEHFSLHVGSAQLHSLKSTIVSCFANM